MFSLISFYMSVYCCIFVYRLELTFDNAVGIKNQVLLKAVQLLLVGSNLFI